ncbi:MAG: DNA-3-methyladenine glycosylase [Chitinophagaceae bacterium]|nr:DNA-3-methyladenine glycosylase [Chitinophagaceae bacterium]
MIANCRLLIIHFSFSIVLLSSLIKLRYKLKKLNPDFYIRQNVLQIARELLGKILVTNVEKKLTSVRVVEVEAYVAITDKASHSYNGRRTNRNEHMYGKGGIAYVYICYGMHHLFNVVTNGKDVPDAVLIRAAEPLDGIETMLARTGKKAADHTLTKGPGNMSRALGLSKIHSGIKLNSKEIFLADDGYALPASAIGASKRIGIDGAGEDAALPYRFYIKGNKYVSGSPVK